MKFASLVATLRFTFGHLSNWRAILGSLIFPIGYQLSSCLKTQAGNIAESEMFRTFNMGIGMVLVVDKDSVDAALAADDGLIVLGEIVPGEGVSYV